MIADVQRRSYLTPSSDSLAAIHARGLRKVYAALSLAAGILLLRAGLRRAERTGGLSVVG